MDRYIQEIGKLGGMASHTVLDGAILTQERRVNASQPMVWGNLVGTALI